MPIFQHSFDPAGASSLGVSVDLTIREIEDAGLREILQTPGVAIGNWGLLDALLDPGNAHFVFREQLGQARETKVAVSGLFGRFVARAYATRFLHYTHFEHIRRPPMRLSGPARGQIQRVAGTRGDLPDWAVWSATRGLGIVEAKGCHDAKGPDAALTRAYNQAGRAEITVRGRRAPFKRYAIATRWGFASPTATAPMLSVRDPDIEGDGVTPEEAKALGVGIVRRHYASLLRPLGHIELSNSLARLTTALLRNQQTQALADARAALDQAPTRIAEVKGDAGPIDVLVGGYVVRDRLLPSTELSISDQETLARLQLRPTFVGIERRVLKLAIEGTVEELVKEQVAATESTADTPARSLRNDGTGAWTIRLEEDQARLV